MELQLGTKFQFGLPDSVKLNGESAIVRGVNIDYQTAAFKTITITLIVPSDVTIADIFNQPEQAKSISEQLRKITFNDE